MFIAVNLNKDIGCEKICRDIQKLYSDYKKANPKDSDDIMLTIQIKKCSYTIDDHIKKLEHKIVS